MSLTKNKEKMFQEREKRCMEPTIQPYDIMPLFDPCVTPSVTKCETGFSRRYGFCTQESEYRIYFRHANPRTRIQYRIYIHRVNTVGERDCTLHSTRD